MLLRHNAEYPDNITRIPSHLKSLVVIREVE